MFRQSIELLCCCFSSSILDRLMLPKTGWTEHWLERHFFVWTHVKNMCFLKKLKPRQWLVYLHCFPLICPFFSMNFEAWTCSNVPWHPALGGISAKRKISDFASWTPGQVMVKWGLNDTTKTNVGYCGIVFMFHVDNMWYEVHVSSSRMRRNC